MTRQEWGSEGALNDYIFAQNGHYLRTDVNQSPDRILIQDVNGVATNWFTNDIEEDVRSIKHYINKYGEETFKQYSFINTLSGATFDDIMTQQGVEPQGLWERTLTTWENSFGKQLDFTAYLAADMIKQGKAYDNLPQSPAIGKVDNTGKFTLDELYFHAPLYRVGVLGALYNLPDAGNFLWSYALTKMGYDIGGIRSIAKGYNMIHNSTDPAADLNAHNYGNYYYKVTHGK